MTPHYDSLSSAISGGSRRTASRVHSRRPTLGSGFLRSAIQCLTPTSKPPAKRSSEPTRDDLYKEITPPFNTGGHAAVSNREVSMGLGVSISSTGHGFAALAPEASRTVPATSARRLGLLALVGVTFFTVSGGAYGLEPLVGAVGPGWAVVLIVMTPLV